MTVKDKDMIQTDESSDGKRVVDHSRRSFAKLSSAVVPAVLTLANRSAWATDQCTQSGFASAWAAASHVTSQANAKWLKPNQWFALGTWPTPSTTTFPYRKVTYRTSNDDYDSIDSPPLWPGQKDLDEVTNAESAGWIILAKTACPWSQDLSNNSTLTLYTALNNSNSVVAYWIASLMNNRLEPFPSYFLPGIGGSAPAASLTEYQNFYSSCTP
ncbi:hypothetical protein QZJ86_05110 [Methylomonas montana]|uniref:hypothetical protein n=1 Tax=Methylomonas montana TaxID=3058963 RepID=UPI00265AF367|nr:hypothetical protein [Methylomonas montana]WKJ91515.1 hypothetical protein QZJ86_05110 [Methylomonas montana]